MTKLRYVRFAAGYGAVFTPNDTHPVDRSAIIDGKDAHGLAWEAFDDDGNQRIIVRVTRVHDSVAVETRIPYGQLAAWVPKAEAPEPVAPPKPPVAASKK
jgi:hypothetical protein